MRVIPGTHTLKIIPHRDTFSPDSLLSRGQEINVDVDEGKAVTLELEPGEMSLHHVKLIHGSQPNPSAKRRIGLAVRYLPPHVRQTAGTVDSAMLVRGVDAFGHFRAERRPLLDLSDAAIAHHAEIVGASERILMRGTGVRGAM
jgi:ectoine hydroxylase-related dioxygenase (phytanoyl-CoA dioxygenase family)